MPYSKEVGFLEIKTLCRHKGKKSVLLQKLIP